MAIFRISEGKTSPNVLSCTESGTVQGPAKLQKSPTRTSLFRISIFRISSTTVPNSYCNNNKRSVRYALPKLTVISTAASAPDIVPNFSRRTAHTHTLVKCRSLSQVPFFARTLSLFAFYPREPKNAAIPVHAYCLSAFCR